MKSMIKNMSVEEREAIMLNMMPQMMKRTDLKIMTPNMLKVLGENISLYGMYDLITKILKDENINSSIKTKAQELLNSMPSKMSGLMPVMFGFMKGFMPKMMSFMMPMMPEMMSTCQSNMPEMMDSCPAELKEQMAGCMKQMMPHCVDHILPAMTAEDKPKFALEMIKTFTDKASEGMSEAQKQGFANGIINVVNKSTTNKED